MKISKNQLVTAEYKLFVKEKDGSLALMEETTGDFPLRYLHGAGMMLPKFEEMLENKTPDEDFEFSIACQDAYGDYRKDDIVDLPLSIFTADGALDTEKIFAGAIVPLVDSTGQRINAEIVSVGEDAVTVDFNHPLAGEELFFKGKIIDVRTPTEEELQTLFGCGCDSCGCEGSDCGSCGQ